MRIAVTGAGGFVGASIANLAVERGHEVIGFVRPKSKLDRLVKGVKVNYLDLRDYNGLASALIEFRAEAIVHAAWAGVADRTKDVREVASENIVVSTNVAAAASAAMAGCIVGIGSQAEYGSLFGRIKETQLAAPTSVYGAAKVSAMLVMREMVRPSDAAFSWMRLFSAYGPHDNSNWLIPSTIEQMLRGTRPKTTLGTQYWDFLYIDDVASGVLVAVEKRLRGVYNLGSGQPTAVRTVVEKLRDLIHPSMDLVFGEIPFHPNQIFHLEADITSLCESADWRPLTTLDQGLHETVSWYRDLRANTHGSVT